MGSKLIFAVPRGMTPTSGCGAPLIEAQAYGTPAFATDFPACPELPPDPIQRLKVKRCLEHRLRRFVELLASMETPKACGMMA